eukprot:174948_1
MLLSIILSLHAFVSTLNAQACGSDCSDCNSFPLGCNEDTVNRCIYDYTLQECNPELCGADCSLCDGSTNKDSCNSDPLCYYLTDNQVCRLTDTCASDCHLCGTESDCDEGAGGNDVCVWVGICLGATCNTACVECTNRPDQPLTWCANSTAPPNGCHNPDASHPENCEHKTSNPTMFPTIFPTNAPTFNPTHEPTSIPSIPPSRAPTKKPTQAPISCGQSLQASLSTGETTQFPLILTTNLSVLTISLCDDFTNFDTYLKLISDSGETSDDDGCNDAGKSELTISDVIVQDYIIEISSFQNTSGGLFKLEIICETYQPTSSPTFDPTHSPTENPTDPPTRAPNVGADEIGCGDDLQLYLPAHDEKIFSWILGFNATQIQISLCYEETDFATKLVLLDLNEQIVKDDESCDQSNATFIEVETGLNSGIYIISVTSANDGEFGSYRITVDCFTAIPTANPTINPTNTPTFNPTSNPTLQPTKAPTPKPTLFPTSDPTSHPTFNPTEIVTLNPTEDPTPNPTRSPTPNPTQNPTKRPSHNPTPSPTQEPVISPTLSPSVITLTPTSAPTQGDACLYCPYNVSLVMIGNVSIEECPTAAPTTATSQSFSSDSSASSQSSSDSRDSDSRSNPWESSSESSSFVGGISTKCMRWDAYDVIASDSDDGTNQGALQIDDDIRSSKCDDNSARRNALHWKTNDAFLSVVCIRYAIEDLMGENTTDCGQVGTVFLGLCENNETDFNSSNIDENELTQLIVSIEPNDADSIVNVQGTTNDKNDCSYSQF